MVIPIPHRRHTYHRQRKNRYGSYGPSNYLIVAIRTIVREKTGTAARVIPIPHRE